MTASLKLSKTRRCIKKVNQLTSLFLWGWFYRCEGDFIDGNRHGHGVSYWSKENSKYEGEWKDDQTNGKGRLTRNDDKWYQGDFQHSKISGKGELHLASGTVAVGSFIGGYVWGFNTVTVPKPAYDNPKAKRTPSLGKWVDPNTYVEQGWFFNDKVGFLMIKQNRLNSLFFRTVTRVMVG